jgi:shikimate dehydrogenase
MAEIECITGHTQMVGLIANPIRHSKSPAMHNASFAQQGVDAAYLVFEVDPDQLAEVVHTFKTIGGIPGYNVSMPNKMAICEHLDELTDAARLMGAVNCVKNENGKAIGYNTDGAGFMRNLKEHGFECAGKRMVLVGAGGAGSAIFVQAALDGMARIDVFNVNDPFLAQAIERAKKVSAETGCEIECHDLADTEAFEAACKAADVLVNASKVGMVPMDDQCLFPEEFIMPGVFVADTVYNPMETKLIKIAKAKGNPVVPGIGMMLWQGAIGEKIWFDIDMDIDYIRDIVTAD